MAEKQFVGCLYGEPLYVDKDRPESIFRVLWEAAMKMGMPTEKAADPYTIRLKWVHNGWAASFRDLNGFDPMSPMAAIRNLVDMMESEFISFRHDEANNGG